MYNNISIGTLLLISHILASIIIGFIYSHTIIHEKKDFLKYNSVNSYQNGENLQNISKFELLQKSILNSFTTLSFIFGFMIIFNLFADILLVFIKNFTSNIYILNILTGIFEVTRRS
ncbi:MAG: hypothetical protein RR290_01195 [Clostridia bacterium]